VVFPDPLTPIRMTIIDTFLKRLGEMKLVTVGGEVTGDNLLWVST
jgi:hypothetical protein